MVQGSKPSSNRQNSFSAPCEPSNSTKRSVCLRNVTFSIPTLLPAAGLSLTTEYTPISRGGQSQPPADKSHLLQEDPSLVAQAIPREPDDGIDTSTLPPATAPPSAPSVDLNVVGVFDGRSILEVDLNAMADKPWRRAGSDISDWFNYGFDELSWETYCIRRRDLGELANVLKTNILVRSPFSSPSLFCLTQVQWTELLCPARRPTSGTSSRRQDDGHDRSKRHDE